MPTVKHPTFRGITEEVPDSDLPAWEAAGWLPAGRDKSKPRPATTPRRKATSKKAAPK